MKNTFEMNQYENLGKRHKTIHVFLVAMGLIALMLFLSSCSPKLTPFNKDLITENDWSDDELSRIQFYLSEDIILRRTLAHGESEITSGTIKLVNGRKVEEILFERGTPGVFSKRRMNNIGVSFEQGDDKYLMFGPGKNRDDYILLAMKWTRKDGTIKYDSKKWEYVKDGQIARLLVDLRKFNETSIERRKAGGRKIE